MYESGAICPALMTLCYDFWSYSIVCVMFGLFLSAWPAVTSSCLVDILGLEHLTSAFGVLTCIRGLSAFLGPPLGGFVIDATSPEKPPVVNISKYIYLLYLHCFPYTKLFQQYTIE